MAVLLSPLVVQTGHWEEEKLQIHHRVFELHETFATWTMWMGLVALAVLWLVKKRFDKYFRTVFLVFLLCCAVLVSLTAYNGGRLVYEYGIGIEE